MQPSGTNDYTVKGTTIPNRGSPVPIARGYQVAMRALVRNLHASQPVFLSTANANLEPTITSEVYELPAGASDVLILAPEQVLYARYDGAITGRVCVAVSEAFPVTVGG